MKKNRLFNQFLARPKVKANFSNRTQQLLKSIMKVVSVALLSLTVIGSFSVLSAQQSPQEILQKMLLETILSSVFSQNNQVNNTDDQVNKTFNEWRAEQPYGLGIGIASSSMPGFFFFFDKNFDGSSQIHIQILETRGGRYYYFETKRSMLSASYRRFVDSAGNWGGFFYGGGFGYTKSQLDYKFLDFEFKEGFYRNQTYVEVEYTYSAKGSGVYAFLDAGWQGVEGFFFHIALQPAAFISYSDDFDKEKIDYAKHRSHVEDSWDETKNISMTTVGFGWFF